jgi:tubby and related proteins
MASTTPATVARRGTASAEKENRGPEDLAQTEEETEKKKVAATEPPAKPATPPLKLRMVDGSVTSSETAVLVGPRGRELLPTPPASSSSYAAWDLSDSESAPASSWATLPNR